MEGASQCYAPLLRHPYRLPQNLPLYATGRSLQYIYILLYIYYYMYTPTIHLNVTEGSSVLSHPTQTAITEVPIVTGTEYEDLHSIIFDCLITSPQVGISSGTYRPSHT